MASAASTSWFDRSANRDNLYQDPSFVDMIAGWHPAIGKAVLENWGFDEHMCEALGDQDDYERGGKERGGPHATF